MACGVTLECAGVVSLILLSSYLTLTRSKSKRERKRGEVNREVSRLNLPPSRLVL